MQEVFEKGIERLRRFIEDAQREGDWSYIKPFEKAIEIVNQIAAEYEKCNKNCTECEAYDKEKHYCPKFCHVIKETVQEIKENNNNGWIPCSKRLPEEPEEASTEEATIEELILDGKIKEYNVTIEGANISTTLYYAGNGYWYDEVIEDYFPVIAWQPLPELYEQKGERKA